MIVDNSRNLARYQGVHPGFEAAIRFLMREELGSLPAGKHEIMGDAVFAIIAHEPGVGRARARLEAHRDYIDIQFVIAGEDMIGWRPAAECSPDEQGYLPAKDILFFQEQPCCWIPLPQGTFAILYPDDAHAPMAVDGKVHKAVVKVRLQGAS